MVLAVSQRVDVYLKRRERRDALDQRLIEFLTMSGKDIIPIPNVLVKLDRIERWLKSLQLTGVVLSGGNDIGVCQERDDTENALISYAIDKHLPVLGICRGMQMIASYFGGQVKTIEGHIGTRHKVFGVIEGEVNSFHSQGLKDLPNGFDALARSIDGDLEAIRHKTLQIEGWMWHPEREPNFHRRDIERLMDLLK